MKKIFFILFVMISTVVSGQTLTRVQVLKSLELGVIKLQLIIQNSDTLYSLSLADLSTSRNDRVIVGLGSRENALRLFNILLDLKLNKDDVLELENETKNYVKRNSLGGFYIFHELGVRYGRINKQHIKTFINVLQGKEIQQEGKDKNWRDDKDAGDYD